jgi:hypothetical protein
MAASPRSLVRFVLVVGVIAGATSAAAAHSKLRVDYNPRDQAAAHAVVIKHADLGRGTWTGGPTKVDFNGQFPDCPTAGPHETVVTGAAATDWKSARTLLSTHAQVVTTPAMLRKDWDAIVPCLPRTLVKVLGSQSSLTVVGAKRIAFPHLTDHSAAFQARVMVRSQGQVEPLVAEYVLVGKGRTEISLGTLATEKDAASVSAGNVRLARLLLSRVRA